MLPAEPLPEFVSGYLPNPESFYQATLDEVEARFCTNGYREAIWEPTRALLERLKSEIDIPFADVDHDFISARGVPRITAIGIPLHLAKKYSDFKKQIAPAMLDAMQHRIRPFLFTSSVTLLEEFQAITDPDEEDFELPVGFRKAFVRIIL